MHQNFYLREVTMQDITILFDWTNDPVTRQNSFQTAPVLWEEHVMWLNRKLNDENCFFYILTDGEKNYGTIRLDYKEEDSSALISFSVDAAHRGQGMGNYLLALAEKKAMEISTGEIAIKTLIGEVKIENLASSKSFEKNGYLLKAEENGEYIFTKNII